MSPLQLSVAATTANWWSCVHQMGQRKLFERSWDHKSLFWNGWQVALHSQRRGNWLSVYARTSTILRQLSSRGTRTRLHIRRRVRSTHRRHAKSQHAMRCVLHTDTQRAAYDTRKDRLSSWLDQRICWISDVWCSWSSWSIHIRVRGLQPEVPSREFR